MNRYSIPSNIQVLKLINPRPLFPTFNNVEIKSESVAAIIKAITAGFKPLKISFTSFESLNLSK